MNRLSIIVPTIFGGRTQALLEKLGVYDNPAFRYNESKLGQLFSSIWHQDLQDDEVIVIGDTGSDDLFGAAELVEAWDHQARRAGQRVRFRYWPFSPSTGHHCFGHCQMNYGMRLASREFLSFIDDDDIYAEGAFERIRTHALTGNPLLFQFIGSTGATIWEQPIPKQDLKPGHVGGHCIVVKRTGPLGAWTCAYEGDFDFIQSTLNAIPEQPWWVPEVIAISRPRLEQCWWTYDSQLAGP